MADSRFEMSRAVGVVVVGLAAMAGVMLWLALALSDRRPSRPQPHLENRPEPG